MTSEKLIIGPSAAHTATGRTEGPDVYLNSQLVDSIATDITTYEMGPFSTGIAEAKFTVTIKRRPVLGSGTLMCSYRGTLTQLSVWVTNSRKIADNLYEVWATPMSNAPVEQFIKALEVRVNGL